MWQKAAHTTYQLSSISLVAQQKPYTEADDDELMLNVLRCQLTY